VKAASLAKIDDKGYTFQFGFDPNVGNDFLYLLDESKTLKQFDPLQFHVHAPSEHTFNGKTYDLELHIVHINNGSLSVLGIFFDRVAGGNTANWWINEFIGDANKLNTTAGQTTGWTAPNLDMTKLVRSLDTRKVYHYEGSLTTPTCDEIVEWLVVHDVQSISDQQLQFFTKEWAGNSTFARGKGNNRGVQPLNGRTIYYYSSAVATYFTAFTLAALALVML
jgi:carbonic anhydrase